MRRKIPGIVNQTVKNGLIWLLMPLVFVGGCNDPAIPVEKSPPDNQLTAPTLEKLPLGKPVFAGSASCEHCHSQAFEDWRGSHHQQAMQIADETTVLGDFANTRFDYFGEETEFVTENGVFKVRTENAQGELQDFTVTHTFGIEPLQQYLVEFEKGRKQALQIVWDTRPVAEGGQRWFHLYPDEEIKPDDVLHWTGRYFNWNLMCAECHSTDLKRGYDRNSNSFNTTYDEISVGCEACHGPGSNHIAQAAAESFSDNSGFLVNLNDRGAANWIMNPDTGIANRSKPARRQQQPESCGRCHARRGVLTDNYEYGKALADTHSIAFLDEPLYFADGRIQDEVYVYGSFVQSKMYAAGVTCTDCHNPHSGELVTGTEPNDVCSQCHLPARFATQEHSKTSSTSCVDCHMPATTYMGNDDRHDHSFRVPGAGESTDHYGAAIAAGRQRQANSEILKWLNQNDSPAIAKGTLYTLLAPPLAEAEFRAIQQGLINADPMVRIGATRAMQYLPPLLLMQHGKALLRDPIRGVRTEAARVLAPVASQLPPGDRPAFESAANEHREALLAAASMPESLTILGDFEAKLGDTFSATGYFEQALILDPDLALARHAYGLTLVRAGQSDTALEQLRLANELEPANARYVYVYAVALNSMGQTEKALQILETAKKQFPDDLDIFWALVTMLRDHGETGRARLLAKELAQRFPDVPAIEALEQSLAPSNNE